MRRRLLLCTMVVLSCFQVGDSAPPRVSFLKPIPAFVSDRDLIPLKIRVEPDPRNRWLILLAVDRLDGAQVLRSDEQLDGDKAPRTRTVWRRFPAGDLYVISELWTTDHILGRAQIPLCVMAMAGELCPSLSVEP